MQIYESFKYLLTLPGEKSSENIHSFFFSIDSIIPYESLSWLSINTF